MVSKISQPLAQVLQAVNFKPEQRKQIEACIIGYTPSKSCSDKCKAVFYRIWNAIKHIFGKSDWQLARKALNDYAWTQIPAFVIFFQQLAPPSVQSKMKKDIMKASQEGLKLMINVNSKADESKIKALREFIDIATSITNAMKIQLKAVTGGYPDADNIIETMISQPEPFIEANKGNKAPLVSMMARLGIPMPT